VHVGVFLAIISVDVAAQTVSVGAVGDLSLDSESVHRSEAGQPKLAIGIYGRWYLSVVERDSVELINIELRLNAVDRIRKVKLDFGSREDPSISA
jgi:hypothetical protein